MSINQQTKSRLEFYGFNSKKPDWLKVSQDLNLRNLSYISRIDGRQVNINSNTNKNSLMWKDFVVYTKNSLKRKYDTDNELVVVNWSANFQKKWNGKNHKWQSTTTSGLSTGKRYEINNIVNKDYENRIENISNDSPYETKNWQQPTISNIKTVPITGGKLVAKGIRVAKMRRVGAMKLSLDFIGDDSWDRKQDTCVFDYIIHKYAGRDRIKKFLPANNIQKCYDNLTNLFIGDDIEDRDPINDGVDIQQLEKFCREYDISMISLDKNENFISYIKSNNRNHPTLIFIICNNHFYPIETVDKRMSLSAKNTINNSDKIISCVWKSDDIMKFEKTIKEYDNIVYPLDDEIQLTGNNWAFKKICELGVMPMPKSLRVDENNITSFVINNTLYLTQPPNKFVVDYIINSGIPYSGQSANSILIEIWDEFNNGIKTGENYDDENDCMVDVITKPESIKSILNPIVYQSLETAGVKYRTHYGATKDLSYYLEETNGITLIDDMINKGKAIMVDISKCYSACLKNPYDNWIKYSIEDKWENYDGELKTGLYYVETDDLTILHQTNIYSNKIIELALQHNISLTIKKQLIHEIRYEGEKPISKEYFLPLLDMIKEKTKGQGDMTKILNNLITGYLGKTTNTNYSAELDEDIDAVWRHFVACEKPDNEDDFVKYFFNKSFEDSGYNRFHKDNLVFNSYETDDRNLYLYGYEIRSALNEHTLPMYIQILDWANMRLFQLQKDIGGEIIYRHTDCVVSIGGKIPTDKLNSDWGNYRIEEKSTKGLKSIMKSNRHIKQPIFHQGWNKNTEFNSSSNWKEIINYAIENGGLLLEGRAGTGKSYVPKSAFKEGIMTLDKDTKAMSFTNKASRNICGTTIHKLLKINTNGVMPKQSIEKLKYIKYFIIDEIGMINIDLWKYIVLLKKQNPKAIFILLGDYRQLPPIEEGRLYASNPFKTDVVKWLVNSNKIELTERQRYDKELWDFLEKGYEEGNWDGLIEDTVNCNDIYNSKNICYYNKTRTHINNICMDYFKEHPPLGKVEPNKQILRGFTGAEPQYKEQSEYLILENDDKKNNKGQTIYLYEGLPLMCVKNNTNLGIINSEEFEVLSYDDDKVYLKRDEGGENIEIDIDEITNLFVPNYCSTTHKSQGSTYNGRVILHDWKRLQSNKKVCYTACSRATAKDKLLVCLGIK